MTEQSDQKYHDIKVLCNWRWKISALGYDALSAKMLIKQFEQGMLVTIFTVCKKKQKNGVVGQITQTFLLNK